MNYPLSVQELRTMIGAEKLCEPVIDDAARIELGTACMIIDELGLPVHHADWFQCTRRVVPFPDAKGRCYLVDGTEHSIERAVVIGQSEFGSHVVDCDTGCVVYIESSSDPQLINTSIERFLHFIGYFNNASNEGFADVPTLRRTFEEIDAPALRDTEGVWAVMLEEAEAGLY